MNYLDFELEIGLGAGREYPVAVVRSPAGEARETMRFPFDELALENRLKDLQIALLRSGGQRRKTPLPEEQAVQDFGRALFDALFTGEVRSRYDMSWREAMQKEMGLRLKLRIQPPQLATLPWEFLYDPRQADYVCLSRNTPIVRYLEIPQPIQPLTVAPPLRILGMAVSPDDPHISQLDLPREKQRVEEATKHLRERGLIELIWFEGQTWRDLQKAMRAGPWHIFHFIGHGGFDKNTDEGLIYLADENRKSERLTATNLGRLLADHRSLRLVLLNACEGARGSERDLFSSTAAILVRRGLPAVLAMQHEITDRAAIEFSREFYDALAEGNPVDTAVVEARKAVSLAVANTIEWGTPVLYMRSPDGRIFNLSQAAEKAIASENWKMTIEKVQEIPVLQPTHAEARTILSSARQELEAQKPKPSQPVIDEQKPFISKPVTPAPKPVLLRRQKIMQIFFSLGVVLLLVLVFWVLKKQQDDLQKSLEAEKSQSGVPTRTEKEIPPDVVRIAGGSFMMGSDDYDNEKPVHEVRLNDFYIGNYEVTVAQYRQFLEANSAYQKPANWDEQLQYRNRPVVYVSWNDATSYCDWLSRRTGKPYRLPTEAEWEYAARGGNTGVNGKPRYEYPWGNEIDTTKANYYADGNRIYEWENAKRYLKNVDSYSPNGYGLYNMAGNVWEWCADWYNENYYHNSPNRNPEGPSNGTLRVLRGGAWYSNRSNVRCADRNRIAPTGRSNNVGFRCVQDVR